MTASDAILFYSLHFMCCETHFAVSCACHYPLTGKTDLSNWKLRKIIKHIVLRSVVHWRLAQFSKPTTTYVSPSVAEENFRKTLVEKCWILWSSNIILVLCSAMDFAFRHLIYLRTYSYTFESPIRQCYPSNKDCWVDCSAQSSMYS